ncbi:2-aminoethylphosphonate--pyruvate transaminase [Polystyrenella longa]|uniref:2-aminoethylphosphonate--pyruvate transaminase n=1 Tax=Polystyrenella longa TaxID=2528007 RepID=A0A518CGK2_9PLAN|nr:2-aminoethylphosphonate--pyruvate transaminase [Polystyrenella longa]QDU78347.1 2-aminoethylphosphonate--pyruvate transaminase [Polystyrenella longa]
MDPEIPYLLLTPGPLSTSRTVREAMLHDYSTWDVDYNAQVNEIRQRLVRLATVESGADETGQPEDYTTVLMQGSGTFSVEATIGSVIPPDGKLLVISNGKYGARVAEITRRLNIPLVEYIQPEVSPPDLGELQDKLNADPDITHVAMVHCETTTGMLNPAAEVGRIVKQAGKIYIVDAMSSFGGYPMSMESLSADYLISSANKCIEGVPGFGFIIANRKHLEATQGWARSLSFDLHDQWQEMEKNQGKWRYTSPTHVVLAFLQALKELAAEGGIPARHARYTENQQTLVTGLRKLGLKMLLSDDCHSVIITSIIYPDSDRFHFQDFYDRMKSKRFVLYPGKVSQSDTFRIGNIGHVFVDDIHLLVKTIRKTLEEMGVTLSPPE